MYLLSETVVKPATRSFLQWERFASKCGQREDQEAGKWARNNYHVRLPVRHWLVWSRRMENSESGATDLSERPAIAQTGPFSQKMIASAHNVTLNNWAACRREREAKPTWKASRKPVFPHRGLTENTNCLGTTQCKRHPVMTQINVLLSLNVQVVVVLSRDQSLSFLITYFSRMFTNCYQ